MLQFLRIRNFAIIENLEAEFSNGLNIVTGETGAGKSILLDAIGLILGYRANTDSIRSGCEEAVVEAIFDIKQNQKILNKLYHSGFDAQSGNNELLIKRTIHRNGKNKIFLNGELITLGQLEDICKNLVEVCSQHEHQSLALPSMQLELLDRYGGLLNQREEIKEHFSAMQSIEHEITSLKNSAQNQNPEDMLQLLQYQIKEIDDFNWKLGEEEVLNAEKQRLSHAMQLLDTIQTSLNFLEGSDSVEEAPVLVLLNRIQNKVSKTLDFDPSFLDALERLERAKIELKELSFLFSSYLKKISFNSEKQEEIEKRLFRFSELKKKYNTTSEGFLSIKINLEKEIEKLSQYEDKIIEKQRRYQEIQKSYYQLAQELSKKRHNIANALQTSICRELSELNMSQCRFKVCFEKCEASPVGIDRVIFLFSANPGESEKPIEKVVSGGELSRLFLSIRRTIADQGSISVYLFDEVDAGIGGHTAHMVGKKLKSVAKHNQVLCITHLPQVAAFADTHYSVAKQIIKGRTVSQILLLQKQDRIEELARMLGGIKMTLKSKEHAEELLKQAVT